MKRFLLLCIFSCLFYLSKAQVVLNEIYSQPGGGNSEFFEIYNSSTDPIGENVNCFTLVTYFEEGSKKGFYVIDLPNLTILPKGFLVGASANPFNYQGGANKPAGFNWNQIPSTEGYLKRWVQVANGPGNTSDGNASYDEELVSNVNDIFSFAPVNGGSYYVFVYKNGVKVNDFLGATGGNVQNAVNAINAMPLLSIDMTGCTDFSINFPALTVADFENVVSADGKDNGYIRKYDGKCGSWDKASNNHTPGSSNGSAADILGSLTTTNIYNCSMAAGATSSIVVNVVGATGEATAANTLPVEVQLYYDNPNVGLFGKLDGTDIYKSSLIFTSFTGPSQSFTIPAADRGQPVILVYKTALGCFDKIVDLTADCITILPVSFSNFHAQRNKQTVVLKWETATEQNNRGFYVQRNTKGIWENIAFVFSAADGGNSSGLLSYSYNDINNEKGVSQYRIQQVDLDNKASYSVIRSVKGEGQVSRTVVYPNPSTEGKVNVVFEDQGAKAVTVSYMSGRMVRQYRSVVNNVVVDGLETGMYTIQITDLSSAVSTTEKVIIKKR